jgi:hypothetical protein
LGVIEMSDIYCALCIRGTETDVGKIGRYLNLEPSFSSNMNQERANGVKHHNSMWGLEFGYPGEFDINSVILKTLESLKVIKSKLSSIKAEFHDLEIYLAISYDRSDKRKYIYIDSKVAGLASEFGVDVSIDLI